MYADQMTVSPPKIGGRQFVKPLLCGAGPCSMWPTVAEAFNRPIITPYVEDFIHVMDDVRAGIQYLFQTKSRLVFPVSGPAHVGISTAITNLVATGETLLVATRGMWCERATMIAERHEIDVQVLKIPCHETFKFSQLEEALKKLKPAALYIVHGDSSTGNVQKLEGLGDICHKYGTLLIVDTVVSISGAPFFMDSWGVDAVIAAPQKALSGPSGISPVAFSALAEKKIYSSNHKMPFYFDVKLLAEQFNCYDNKQQYHHTVCSPLLWALHCCLEEVARATLPNLWARHAATAAHFYKRLEEYGFEFYIKNPENRLVTVTTIVLPKGYDYTEFTEYMMTKHNILIYPGIGPTYGKMLRIGTMGVSSTIEMADKLADALGDTLQNLKPTKK